MANEWHYTHLGVRLGPVSDAELKTLARNGGLLPTDMIWKEGMESWVEATKTKNLFSTTVDKTEKDLGSAQTSTLPGKSGPPAIPTTSLWKSAIAEGKKRVVLIEHGGGIGAGITVTTNGLIITNSHVVQNTKFVTLTYGDNTLAKGAVIHHDKDKDLAVIKSSVNSQFAFDLRPNTVATPEVGDEVIAIGHPHGHRFTFTRGIVSSVYRKVSGQSYVQHDVAINPGNSGGPIIDQTGSLIGVNTFGHRNADGLGFAIPAESVRLYLEGTLAKLQKSELLLPEPDEIVNANMDLSPLETLTAAVQMLPIQIREKDGGFAIQIASDLSCHTFINNGTLLCYFVVANLNSRAVDGGFLLNILRHNNSLMYSKYSIANLDDGQFVILEGSRDCQGMDVLEAYSLVNELVNEAKENAIRMFRVCN